MASKSLPKPEVELPKPQTDLPLPEKVIPEHVETPKTGFHFPKSAFIAGILVVLLIGLGGGYLLFQNNAKQTSYFPTPTKQTDETANWETYSDSFGGFTFKHPNDWIVEDASVTSITQARYLKSSNYSETEDDGPAPAIINSGYSLYILVENNPSLKDYDSYKNFILNKSTGRSLRANSEDVVVDDEKCLLSRNLDYGGGFVSACSMYHDGKTIDITLRSKTKDEKIFNQILSTFKFSDSMKLEIKELGIILTLSDEIKDLIYSPKTVNGETYIYLSTTSVANEGAKYPINGSNTCTADSGPLGSLSKVNKAGLTDDPDLHWSRRLSGLRDAIKLGLVKEFPDFFIVFTTPQSACGNGQAPKSFYDLLGSTGKAISKAIPTIEVIPAR